MQIQHLRLPEYLRKDLADPSNPIGKLIEGPPDVVAPLLKTRFANFSGIVVTVGDVVSQMLLSVGCYPQIMVTDGSTKRAPLQQQVKSKGYSLRYCSNPAGEISVNAWELLREVTHLVQSTTTKFHCIVEGEEDLLVLPLISEFGSFYNYRIVYGQPNRGAVIISGTQSKTFKINQIISNMEIL